MNVWRSTFLSLILTESYLLKSYLFDWNRKNIGKENLVLLQKERCESSDKTKVQNAIEILCLPLLASLFPTLPPSLPPLFLPSSLPPSLPSFECATQREYCWKYIRPNIAWAIYTFTFYVTLVINYYLLFSIYLALRNCILFPLAASCHSLIISLIFQWMIIELT